MSVVVPIDAGRKGPINPRTPRRQYPRVDIELPVALLLPGGSIVQGRIRDLSPAGLRIMTSRATAHAIHPSGRAITSGQTPELKAAFTLPLPSGEGKVIAHCRIANFAVTDAENVVFSLAFIALRPDGARHLRRFIEQALIPAM